MNKIVPNLWFNGHAVEAVNFYLSVFPDGRILSKDFYTDVGTEITGKQEGELLTIEFEIRGTRFVAINAGPEFRFNPSVSLGVEVETQEELDEIWSKLSAVPEAEQCGWLVDRYGLSWQVYPRILNQYLQKGTREQRRRVTEVFMEMKKFDLEALKRAYEG